MNSSVGDPRWQMIFAFEHETALFVSLVASIANLYNALLPQGLVHVLASWPKPKRANLSQSIAAKATPRKCRNASSY
jgi:hypothetical protein